MKKIVLTVLCAAVLSACNRSSEFEEVPVPVRSSSISETGTSVAVENGMLKFADEAALERTLSQLLQLDEAALAAWYDSVGFVSQEMAREAALEEFRSMESLDEYPAFKAKYAGRFLFNDNLEEEDYQPYVAASRFAYEMILNADGNVIVGGEVVNYNYDRFEQTMYYRVAHESEGIQPRISPETKTNQVYVKTKKKKCWAWAYLVDNAVYIQVTAQKKNIFGWNDYKTEYCFSLAIRDFSQTKTQNWDYLNPELAGSAIGEERWTPKTSCNTRIQWGTKADMAQFAISDLTVKSTGTNPASGLLHIEL